MESSRNDCATRPGMQIPDNSRYANRLPHLLANMQNQYRRETDSATHTGLSLPSRSIVTSQVTCAPPAMSSTVTSVMCARRRLPTGTGDGKRTLFKP